jgi:hypothetical protein
MNQRGLLIRFTDSALFDSGEADIKPEIFPILQLIADEVKEIPNMVAVEGHTDPTPINTARFPSNWWLSTARAAEVVHWLIEEGDVIPQRLQASGFSYFHPIVSNDTPENRARNRRVDVIILFEQEIVDEELNSGTIDDIDDSATDGLIMFIDEEGEVKTDDGFSIDDIIDEQLDELNENSSVEESTT